MKTTKKAHHCSRLLPALLFLLVLLAALGAAGCNRQDGGKDGQTDEPTGTAVPLAELIKSGASDYVLVRPDECGDGVKQAAVRLRAAIKDACGVELPITSDFEKRDFDISQRCPTEIVVGATNRVESAAALAEIGYLDTTVRMSGTRLVITGGCEDATVEAVDHFISAYLTGSDLCLPEDLCDTSAHAYPRAGLRVDGVPLSEYRIVFTSKYKQGAAAMADRIGRLTGAVLPVVSDSSEPAEREIVLGSTKRGAKGTYDTIDDFSVTVSGKSLLLSGGSDDAVSMAGARLCARIAELPDDAALSDLALTYRLPDRSVYAADPSQLVLHWELTYQPEEWMLDFDEKYAAILDPNGRMISCLHRGDMVYYPENSLEGYISAVRMGGDMIEIDPRLTKDGVFVLMHDATLTRTTDFDQKAGKNGLPTSANLCDWTYDQLMQLNLKTANGGSSARVTPYKIPTLEEAFRVAAGHVFIRLDVKGPDSGGMFWDYGRDIWPLIEKYKGYETVIFTWHSVFSSNNYALVKTYKQKQEAACGRSAIHFLGVNASRTASAALTVIKTNDLDPVVRLTDYDWSAMTYQKYLSDNESKFRTFKGKARMYIDANANGTNITETPAVWDDLYDAGINILLINKGLDFCRYIKDNYQPETYTK